MQIHTLGINLGKTVFHVVGLNAEGEIAAGNRFLRRPTCPCHFSLATTRRTIHSDLPSNRKLPMSKQPVN